MLRKVLIALAVLSILLFGQGFTLIIHAQGTTAPVPQNVINTLAIVVPALIAALLGGIVVGQHAAVRSADRMIQNIMSSPLLIQQGHDLANLVPIEVVKLIHDGATLVEKVTDATPAQPAQTSAGSAESLTSPA